jgi:peptidoglycan/LPS O-acetylase OafA/YrhL
LTASIKYRPDVDGLRAIAVTAVVAYHAGLPGVGGGYVGVDVFFVISGFLITQLLVGERERTGRIDLIDFYARRTRRLIPALALVLAATLALGWALLPADEQQGLGRSALATIGFVSNLWFWRGQAGYFHPQVEILPLLHTWSLAVEEQFYLAWPLLIMAASRIGSRRLLTGAVCAAGLASLALTIVMTARTPSAAFYLSPFRAFELAAGCLLAIMPAPSALRPRVGGVLGLLGLAAVVGAALLFDRRTPFPGAYALAPVLGTSALIAAGQLAPRAPVTRLLGSAPMTFIGRRSYSWYLWHWPLLAVARSHGLGDEPWRDLGLAAFALVLASLTYSFVEKPTRSARTGVFAHRRTTLAAGAVLLGACAALAAALIWNGAAAERTDPRYAAIALARETLREAPDECQFVGSPVRALPDPRRCLIGPPGGRTVLLLGDSHAAHLWPALKAAGEAVGVKTLSVTQNGCRPQSTRPDPEGEVPTAVERDCPVFNGLVRKALPDLTRRYGLTGVVVAASWRDQPTFEDDLTTLAQRLRAQGLTVLLVADAPHHPFDTPACLARRAPAGCALDRRRVDADRAGVLAALRKVAGRVPGTTVFDPVEALCDANRCEAESGGVIFYKDEGHLSAAGSRLLTSRLAPVLDQLAGKAAAP